MNREEAILWMQVLKHSKINWVGEQAEDEDIIARCEEAEQEAFDMAIEALSVANLKEEFESAEYEDYEHATLVDIKEPLKVLVVRCKDCVWSKEWNDNQIFCDRILMRLRETDFCSYGEGREPTE